MYQKILQMDKDNHFFIEIYENALSIIKQAQRFEAQSSIHYTKKQQAFIGSVMDKLNIMQPLLAAYIETIQNAQPYSVYMDLINSAASRKHLNDNEILSKLCAQRILSYIFFKIGWEINQGHAKGVLNNGEIIINII